VAKVNSFSGAQAALRERDACCKQDEKLGIGLLAI
jgi:hypothetical protein